MILAAVLLIAQTRIASDFEMQQMEKQVAQQHGFISQLSGHLNLGDLRLARNETKLATEEYAKVLEIATRERGDARKASDMSRYADATAYAALAEAKLSHDAEAFVLGEEALRYASDSARTWNLYANAMVLLHRPAKAVSAERNAVALATEPIDVAIYKYALAASLIDLGQRDEAKQLLVDVVTALKSKEFASVRSNVARNEMFEIYSSARGEESAYVTLLNRSQLRLAALYESEDDLAKARATYKDVLATRTDDPTALTALARLATNDEERAKYFAQAFDANPFSMPLIEEYFRSAAPALSEVEGAKPPLSKSVGSQVRQAIDEMKAGELKIAQATLDKLITEYPNNETLKTLRKRAEEQGIPAFMTTPPKTVVRPTATELRQLANAKNLDRRALDVLTFESTVVFSTAKQAPNQTVFESGTVEGVPFRFAEPIAFTGAFAENTPLRLTYRILGATDVGLLLEPMQLQEIK